MTENPHNRNVRSGRTPGRKPVQPFNARLLFWFSASNYYILAAAISTAAFFSVWGIVGEGGEGNHWIAAALVAALVLTAAVVLRNLFLQKMRRRIFLRQQSLDFDYKRIHQTHSRSDGSKLTIEKNALILEEIEKKSKAARILEKLPDGHLEVFELCEEYLRKSEDELKNAGVGSPRLPILRKSRESVEKLHRYHLLSWASLESRMLIQEAKIQSAVNDKLDHSQRALSVLDSALQFYPSENLLTESAEAVKEFITSVRVGHWTEQAERSVSKKNYKRAISHYRDALFFLARENERTPERDLIAEKINSEIQKITQLQNQEKGGI